VRFTYESDRKSYFNDKVYFLFIHKLKFQTGVSKHVSLLYHILDEQNSYIHKCENLITSTTMSPTSQLSFTVIL